jgi:hypothetical protein
MVFQVASLSRFLKQSFDYCVVDDSKDESTSEEIKKLCNSKGYEYLRCPPHAIDRQAPSARHADALMHGWIYMSRNTNYKYIGTLDNDIFLVSPLDLDEVLEDKNIIMVKHTREHIQYFWPGCCIWRCDTHTLDNFLWDISVDQGVRTDTGGTTYTYWKENMEKMKEIQLLEYQFLHISQEKWPELIQKYLPPPIRDFCIKDIHIAKTCGIKWWSDIYADPDGRFVFFHLRDVSNWQGIHELYLRNKVLDFCVALQELIHTAP